MKEKKNAQSEGVPKPPEHLCKASEHLRYECWMLFELSEILGATGDSTPRVIRNALLESFLIHARVLVEFFYKEATGDDICAADFFQDRDEWIREHKEKPEILSKAKRDADKRLAHLTNVRLRMEEADKGWDFPKITEAIRNVLKEFREKLPPGRLGPSWENGC